MIINYGIGICTDDIKDLTIDKIKALVALVPNSLSVKALLNQALLDALDDEIDDVNEFADYIGQGWKGYDEVGIATVLAVVIDACENVRMQPIMDSNGNSFLIFPERYPWQYNSREKQLIDDDVYEIIGKYVRILTAADITIEKIGVEND